MQLHRLKAGPETKGGDAEVVSALPHVSCHGRDKPNIKIAKRREVPDTCHSGDCHCKLVQSY